MKNFSFSLERSGDEFGSRTRRARILPQVRPENVFHRCFSLFRDDKSAKPAFGLGGSTAGRKQCGEEFEKSRKWRRRRREINRERGDPREQREQKMCAEKTLKIFSRLGLLSSPPGFPRETANAEQRNSRE
ncbi:UNVERIFIED_CONTAM: hypothetical protein HHA_454640 [Hammondia hammondi]|eukprot:XP_008888215.1 hypothetical protein HHA_454640 [Hammondia hammondi]